MLPTRLQTETISTIDQLNQFKLGNVTADGLRESLEDMLLALDGIYINK